MSKTSFFSIYRGIGLGFKGFASADDWSGKVSTCRSRDFVFFFLIKNFSFYLAFKKYIFVIFFWKKKKKGYNYEKCYIDNIFTINPNWHVWVQRDLETSAHFISGPRPTPRRKKCPRRNERNPDCQSILSRTTMSSADQNHRRRRHHVARSSPLEDLKRDSKPNRPAIRAW